MSKVNKIMDLRIDYGLLLTSVECPAYKEILFPFAGNSFGFKGDQSAKFHFQANEQNRIESLKFGLFTLYRKNIIE